MLKKRILGAGLLGGAMLFSGQLMAASDWGPCEPTSLNRFDVPIQQTITDVSKNVSGMVFPDSMSWNLGKAYNAICQCPAGTGKLSVYFKGVNSLALGQNVGGRQYYVVNDNIQVSADVWIEGSLKAYKTIPFDNVSNESPSRINCDVDPSDTGAFSTGSEGKISLYINHPFVGQMDIPSTLIADLYGTRKASVYSAQPLVSVYLSGSVTVPQGCELTSGSTLEIPFGEFQARDFKDRKGQQPVGSSPITKTLEFKCTNISDGIKIYLRLEGTPNASDSNAIDLGNPDIGAITENSSGQIMIPNDSQGQPLNVSALTDETHRTASTELKFYPVSTTGKMPTAGDFEGIATLRIDVE